MLEDRSISWQGKWTAMIELPDVFNSILKVFMFFG